MPDTRTRSHGLWIAPVCVLLIAAAVRLHQIGGPSYWLDELFALELSTGNGFPHESIPVNALPIPSDWDATRLTGFHPLRIWAGQVVDSHPPLYFIALGAWRAVVGSGESAVRLLSMLFSLLTLALVYLSVKGQSTLAPVEQEAEATKAYDLSDGHPGAMDSLTCASDVERGSGVPAPGHPSNPSHAQRVSEGVASRTDGARSSAPSASSASLAAALWTTAILAVSGTQIQYAQEARNYTMVMAILYALIFTLLRARRRGTLTWPACALIAALLWAGFVTHYLFLGPAAGVMLYALVAFTKPMRIRLLLTGAAATAALAISWGPFLITQRANGFAEKITWMGTAPGHSLLSSFAQLEPFVWDNLLVDHHSPAGVRFLLSLALLFAAIHAWRNPRLRIWLAAIAGGLGFIIATDWMDGTQRLAVMRYTLMLTPAIIAAIVLSVAPIRGLRHVVPAAILGLCLLRIGDAYVDRKADWRGITAWLMQHAGEGDLIVFTAPRDAAWIGASCQLAIAQYHTWPAGRAPEVMLLDRPPTPELRAAMFQHPGKVILVSPHPGLPPDGIASDLRTTLLQTFDPTMSFYAVEPEAAATKPAESAE